MCLFISTQVKEAFAEHVMEKYSVSMDEKRAGAIEEKERDFKRKEFAIATQFGSRHTRWVIDRVMAEVMHHVCGWQWSVACLLGHSRSGVSCFMII